MTTSAALLVSCLMLLAGGLTVPAAAAPSLSEPPRGTFRMVPEGLGLAARDVPVGEELLDRPLRTEAVDLVGLTWRGEGAPIRVRSRSEGVWSAWRATSVLDDGPDRGSPEDGVVVGTDLVWVGNADRVQIDVRGKRPEGLSLTMIDVGGVGRAVSTSAPGARAVHGGNEFRPRIRGRAAWGADPRLREGRPSYNRTIQQVHVHHTVNSNAYSAADVPGLIRGIYRYHTVNLGWSDIGYNFLVDRFGRIWTGRAGGAKRAVQGAHTLGFNSTSTGIAVIGNFEHVAPGQRVLTSLVRLSAWKLHKHGRNPGGSVRVFSHGSDRYPAGNRVRLPVIDGHRDTNQTACPGVRLYDLLPGVRRRAAERVERYRRE